MDKARELLARIKDRLKNASDNDRLYERPMTWAEADLLVAALTPPEAVREPTREMVVVGMAWLRDFDTLSKNDKAKFVAEAYKAMARHALTPPEAERDAVEAETAVLVALAQAGVSTDVQALLVRGNPALGVAPGSLRKALASLRSRVPTPAPDAVAGEPDPEPEADEIDWYSGDVPLSDCPKCGGTARSLNYFRPDSADVSRVECKRCDYTQAEQFHMKDAIERWNATPRPSPPLPLESDNAGEVG